jgi:transcriptional regulator with XRE-family HTH domain
VDVQEGSREGQEGLEMRLPEIQRSGLGAEIRRLRLGRGWTQDQLSEASGVGQSTISALENGRQEQTSLEYLQRLARAFKVSINLLLRAAGIMDDEAGDLSSREAVFRDISILLRQMASAETIDELEALRDENDLETYEVAVRALVGAFASNSQMGGTFWRLAIKARRDGK